VRDKRNQAKMNNEIKEVLNYLEAISLVKNQTIKTLKEYREICKEAIKEVKNNFSGGSLHRLKIKEIFLKIDEDGKQTIVIEFDLEFGNKIHDFLYKFISKKTGNKNFEIIQERQI